jgi:IS605 OrfB family transposase
MKQILSAKLKLHTTPEQFQALRQTQLAYRDALNYVSRYAFAHHKMSNQRVLQKETYDEIRARYGLPSQMACNVPRQVGATYKGLWTKVKQNVAHRQAGQTKKRYKGLDQPPRYISPTLTYNYGYDYSFKTGQHVSVLTLQGRVIVPYTGYAKHLALIQHGATIGTAKLWYDKPHQQFYLLISLEIEVADPTPEQQSEVVGVDVGVRYLAVTTTTTNETRFFPGRQVRARADHLARLKKRLQKKGTRSAIRRLMGISERERRLKANANHVVARRIIERHPHAILGLEHLADIHEQSWRKHEKKATGRQRVGRPHAQWSFAELHRMIAYKAALQGSMTVKVEAHYTSQSCPRCGYTSKANRPDRGLLFVCQSCHYTLHADLIGARNLALRTMLMRQDWMSTGVLSVRPDGSDGEAKAAHLARYAELRWSPDPSPRQKAWGN